LKKVKEVWKLTALNCEEGEHEKESARGSLGRFIGWIKKGAGEGHLGRERLDGSGE